MGDFNIHFRQHNDIVFNNGDIEKENLINKFENSKLYIKESIQIKSELPEPRELIY